MVKLLCLEPVFSFAYASPPHLRITPYAKIATVNRGISMLTLIHHIQINSLICVLAPRRLLSSPTLSVPYYENLSPFNPIWSHATNVPR
ncbi:hypothetical protein Bca101_077325 [Brassica carinata]